MVGEQPEPTDVAIRSNIFYGAPRSKKVRFHQGNTPGTSGMGKQSMAVETHDSDVSSYDLNNEEQD